MTDASPFLIGPRGFDRPQLETLVSLLVSARHFLSSATRGLTVAQLDARPRQVPNSIGALLAHVVAAETLIQNVTFRGKRFMDVQDELRAAFDFERNPLAGRDLAAYRRALHDTRAETLRLLGEVDDDWLRTPRTFLGQPSNTHYYWMHLVQDEARHTGQVVLVRKYLLRDAEASFDPYVAPESIAE